MPSMDMETKRRIAVVGAGLAGATCAKDLSSLGHTVHVFDKSRGPGGRLATRRIDLTDDGGTPQRVHLDHGAPGMTVRTTPFRDFLHPWVAAGRVAVWAPILAQGSQVQDDDAQYHLPVPDMPALCGDLLQGLPTHWTCTVDRLQRQSTGWRVHAGEQRFEEPFDTVVLAIPPAQAAPLIAPHRSDWAEHAANALMQPCWTLMGIATEATKPRAEGKPWDLARPPRGPLSCILRSDRRPGRARVSGQAHWVAHAQADWSQQHLEQPAAWVQQQLQDALADWLGTPVDWRYCTVHRWRYAAPAASLDASPDHGLAWWDATLQLGVCGDFLGRDGAEGAWQSARSLCDLIQPSAHAAQGPSTHDSGAHA